MSSSHSESSSSGHWEILKSKLVYIHAIVTYDAMCDRQTGRQTDDRWVCTSCSCDSSMSLCSLELRYASQALRASLTVSSGTVVFVGVAFVGVALAALEGEWLVSVWLLTGLLRLVWEVGDGVCVEGGCVWYCSTVVL